MIQMPELLLFGTIGEGELTAANIKKTLAAADGDELVARFDTQGGSVFAGLSLFKAFKDYPGKKRAVIESAAFSIGSFLAMAFDEIEIAGNGYLMLHNPTVASAGDDEAHARDAKLLSELKQKMITAYAARSGLPENEITAMMKAETFINAEDALSMGFVSRVSESVVASCVVNDNTLKNRLPYQVCASLGEATPKPQEPEPMAEETKPVAASITEIEKAYPKASSEFVLGCIKRELPLAQVAEEMNTQLQSEIDALTAKNQELTEALEAAKPEPQPEPEASTGNKPVASSGTEPVATATDRWNGAVQDCIKEGLPRAKAVMAASRKNPGLRQEMLAEVNA